MGDGHGLPARHPPRPAGRAPPARARAPGAADHAAVPPALRHRRGGAVGARDRRHRDRARRGGRAPARRAAVPDRRRGQASTSWSSATTGACCGLQLEEVLDGIDPVRRLRACATTCARPARTAPPSEAPTESDGDRRRRGADLDGAAAAAARASSTSSPMVRSHAGGLSTDELLDMRRVSGALGLAPAHADPDAPLEPRGLPAAAPPAPVPRGARGPDRRALRRAASGSCGPRWPISRRSKAWARPAPGRSKTDWPAWPRRAFSTATADGVPGAGGRRAARRPTGRSGRMERLDPSP